MNEFNKMFSDSQQDTPMGDPWGFVGYTMNEEEVRLTVRALQEFLRRQGFTYAEVSKMSQEELVDTANNGTQRGWHRRVKSDFQKIIRDNQS